MKDPHLLQYIWVVGLGILVPSNGRGREDSRALSGQVLCRLRIDSDKVANVSLGLHLVPPGLAGSVLEHVFWVVA